MENRKKILSELFDKYRNEFKELNEYLYNNPELGLQEYKACTAHTNVLKKYGFEIEKGFANLETAYKASYKKGNGPRIAMMLCLKLDMVVDIMPMELQVLQVAFW